MIFHCGNCKAKYQLPDEKVAGRTVRMKCRKCEHLIEAKGPPLAAPPDEAPASVVPASVGAPQSTPTSAASGGDDAPAGAAADGWYAGIDGTPTGPMSAEELATKVRLGAVKQDSLVWREGLPEWKPLHQFPELAPLVAEPPKPAPVPPAPVSAPRVVPVAPVSRPSSAGIPRPPPARASVPRANLAPLSARSSAAPKLDEVLAPDVIPAHDEPHSPAPALALAPAPEPTPPPDTASVSEPPPTSDVEPTASPSMASTSRDSLALAPTAAPIAAPDRAESLVVPIAPKRRRVHPAAWAIVGLGGMLVGIFAGISIAEKPKPEVQIVTVPTPTPPPAPVASAEPVPSEPESTAAEEPKETAEVPAEPEPQKVVAAPSAPPAKSKAAPAPAPAKPSTTAPSMSGLSGLSGLGAGPAPVSGKASSSGGGGALSQAEVERVVQSHRAFVKRRCWELALATKTQGAPTSARVATSITIAPDGRVTNASATGGDGYPGLASCVAGQVRGWKFPPSEGGTVNVPFVFAAQ